MNNRQLRFIDLIFYFRLVFHDCIPYEDGSGGCDGCLNFVEQAIDNNVLQHSVAILVG